MGQAFSEFPFPFSACFDAPGGVLVAHNYVLRLTTWALTPVEEKRLRTLIQKSLIDQVHSRDLGRDVAFLTERPLTEAGVLAAFKDILKPLLGELPLRQLQLERMDGTRTWISADAD